MSMYAHFFKEVSKKCKKILDDNLAYDVRLNREVTHMLALANAAIGIPLERLELNPLSGDNKQYSVAQQDFADLLESSYLQSHLHQNGTWCYGRWSGKPKEWESRVTYSSKLIELHFENSGNPPTVKMFLKHLRNAFAHGNLFFRAKSGEITQVIFIQQDFIKEEIDATVKAECSNLALSLQGKQRKALKKAIKDAAVWIEGYAFLSIAPEDFRKFLSAWFEYVNSLKVEDEVLKQIYGDEVVLGEAAD